MRALRNGLSPIGIGQSRESAHSSAMALTAPALMAALSMSGFVLTGCGPEAEQRGVPLGSTSSSVASASASVRLGTTSATAVAASARASATHSGVATPAGAAASFSAGTGTNSAGAATSTAASLPSAVAGSASPSSSAVAASSANAPPHTRDHCAEGYEPDTADASLVDGPADFVQGMQTDTTVQPLVIDWMQKHKWEGAHFEWHSVRRCNLGTSMSKVNVCSKKEMIPTDQECQSDGDGYQFLVMHRHMLQSLRQLFPKHTEQFRGFAKFPQSADDVPQQWRADWKAFSSQAIANAKIADEIAKKENLDRFQNEGAFGRWLQCQAPSYSGLHGDLHFKWVRTRNAVHGLGNQETNIDNYMFWKLHGWIDDVWEKYRVAKGLAPDEPKLKDELVKQCREMDTLATLIDPSLTQPKPTEPLPSESGVFHTVVRKIFESDTNKCSGCHAETGAEAGLTLGGNISSANIAAKLIGKPSTHGGQFQLVKSGEASKSWLYLKAAGLAATAGCTASNTASCNTQVMPPSAAAMPLVSASELKALKDWIDQGAALPTSP